MSRAAARAGFSLAAWCGWVLVFGLALTPIAGWIVPMGFATLLGLMGLLTLPAIRVRDEDRPTAVLLLVLLVWAAMSTAWSPYHPSKAGNNTALKLAAELPLYWAVICAARRADPRLKTLALKVLAWGSAVFGLLLLTEFATDVGVYDYLHIHYLGPIRHDISQAHIAHSSFVLAVLWPLGLAAAVKTRTTPWLAVAMVAGLLAAALRFGADAPVLSVLLALMVGFAAWRWPAATPRVLAGLGVVYLVGAPAVVWAARATGDYGALQHAVPLSWSMRMGFWSHTFDWIGDHPLRGWGLDASRMFGPGIVLHPHDDALQIWLELGLVGVLLAAGVWWTALRRLARPERDLGAAAVTASASVYLLFGALNFGVWQEWWLALAALVAAVGALMATEPAAPAST
ncbi:O-antigen ligase family protein [Phenylobacterium sp.]|uniref:O-antigen ligase family protein n=1 Tax=Phenylobacterium sp. TaxID=1871053 RepID=UPI002DF0F1EC|nr:O-antigen ligase family protein [Phenylobacterium sp.]